MSRRRPKRDERLDVVLVVGWGVVCLFLLLLAAWLALQSKPGAVFLWP